jgi:hypothetical protein
MIYKTYNYPTHTGSISAHKPLKYRTGHQKQWIVSIKSSGLLRTRNMPVVDGLCAGRGRLCDPAVCALAGLKPVGPLVGPGAHVVRVRVLHVLPVPGRAARVVQHVPCLLASGEMPYLMRCRATRGSRMQLSHPPPHTHTRQLSTLD